MNILYIAPIFPNPINQFQFNEIDFAERNGHTVFIATIHPLKSKLWDERSKELMRLHIIFKPLNFIMNLISFRNVNSFFSLENFKQLSSINQILEEIYIDSLAKYYYNLLKDKNINHIHADFISSPARLAIKLSRLLNVPFSAKFHAYDIYMLKDDLKTSNSKHIIDIFSNSSIIFSEHQFGIDYFKKKFSNIYEFNKFKIIVNRTGIDCEYYSFQKRNYYQDKIYILSVARLEKKKGLDDFVFFCQYLRNYKINFEAFIVGYGPLFGYLKNLIKELDLTTCVYLLNYQSPEIVKHLYYKCNYFFLLSKLDIKTGNMDGIPTSILEAMSCGCVVFSTNISGIPEAVIDGVTGYLCEDSNAKNVFEKFISVERNHDILKTISINARKKIESDFNREIQSSKLINSFKLFG